MKSLFEHLDVHSSLSASQMLRDMGTLGIDAASSRSMVEATESARRYLDGSDLVRAAMAEAIDSSKRLDHLTESFSDTIRLADRVRREQFHDAEAAIQSMLKAIEPSRHWKHLLDVESQFSTLSDQLSVQALISAQLGNDRWDEEIRRFALGALPDIADQVQLAFAELNRFEDPVASFISAGGSARELLEGAIGSSSSLAAQMQQILGSMDLERLLVQATEVGEALATDMAVDDDLPSVRRLSESLGPDQFLVLRESLEATIVAAVIRALAASDTRSKRVRRAIALVLVPMLTCLVSVICQPLFERWLDQRDALQAAQQREIHPTTPSTVSGLVVVRSNGLNLRVGPSTTQRSVVVVKQGQVMRMLKKKRGWALVLYVDPLTDGVSYTGWVKRKYIRSMEQEAQKLVLERLFQQSPVLDD